jgi:hypothetical protein
MGWFAIIIWKIHKKHEISGWENIFPNEIIIIASNKNNPLFTNIKKSNHLIKNMKITQNQKTNMWKID